MRIGILGSGLMGGKLGTIWVLRKSVPERALRKLEEEICFAARRRGTEARRNEDNFRVATIRLDKEGA